MFFENGSDYIGVKRGRPSEEPETKTTVQRESFPENLAELERAKIKINQEELLESDPFYDIIGYDNLKQFLKTAVELPLKQPDVYDIIGSYKGVLLYGPPGTGKTAFARATARMLLKLQQNTKINIIPRFYAVNASNIKSRYLGVGEQKIDDYFTIMRGVYDGVDQKPIEESEQSKYFTILFLDEIDAIAKDRDLLGDSDASSLVPVLLDKMDPAFPVGKGKLFILAATNQPASLDTGLMRRLEQKFYVGLPDMGTRKQVFLRYLGSDRFYNQRKALIDGVMKAVEMAEVKLMKNGYGNLFQHIALLSNSGIVTLVKSLFTVRVKIALNGTWELNNRNEAIPKLGGIKTDDLPRGSLTHRSFEFTGIEDIRNYTEAIYEVIVNTKADIRLEELVKFLWFFRYNEKPPKEYDSSVNIGDLYKKNRQPDSSELYSILVIILKRIDLSPFMVELKFNALKHILAGKPVNLIKILKDVHDADDESSLKQVVG